MTMKKTKSVLVEGSYSHELIIPHTWEFARLKNVIEVIGGSQPPKSDFSDQAKPDYVRLIQIRDYKSDNNVVYIPKNKAKRFVQKNEVMIGRYGPPIFQILRGLEGAYNVALMKAKPIGGIFSNEYLYYFLSNQNLYNYVESASDRTAGQSGVNKKHLEEYPVPIPPLAEQKRIVEKLDQVLAQVDTIKARLDGIPAILKRFRQSVLAAAVSGKLTEEWRKVNAFKAKEIDKGKLKFKQELFDNAKNSLPDLPNEWIVTPSANILEYVTSGSRGWAEYYAEDGALFLRMSNVRYDTTKLDLNDLQYVDLPATVEGKRSLVKENDLIISITADVGRVARITEHFGEAYINQHLALARPLDVINSEYLAFCIASKNVGMKQVQVLKRGATKAGLGLDDIKSLAIPLPSIEEQTEIVRLVDQYFAFADTIEKQVQKAQQRVDRLTQSILAKAFRGELVPQDPTDEPADELLKRIATARKEAEALVKAAKKVGMRK
jgi:type I restriction enzyme S subunit